MKKHLRVDLWGTNGEHPQNIMARLGITYQHAVPQSICDEWWFFNCENIPDNIPDYIMELTTNPIELVGLGLTAEEAKKINEDKKI